ncbi:beta strand repeat-containing protein [Methanobrevibacter sp. DSM 116169]|uniref:beta strand repeat-containing protein n=1 Tax=Methanobrevibacter sp. DSM 116169 TaxID=3242727 RepID=UPI0038FC2D75
MRFLKISLFLLVLISFAGLVSADDMNTNDNEISDISDSQYNILAEEHNFTWLKSQIDATPNGGVIDLNGATVKYDNEPSYTGGMIILNNKVITIQNGIVDGDNSAKIFNVAKGASLTLNNITMINGYTTSTYSSSGITNNGGTVIINSGTYANNNGGSGAVIYNNGGTVIINSGTYANNNGGSGAIIYNMGTVIINNGTFKDNTASLGGTVIFNAGSTSNSVTINNGNFTNNKATKQGSIVYSQLAQLTVNGGYYSYNTAGDDGGLFYSSGPGTILNITGGTFSNNKASKQGGALMTASGAILNVTGGTFINNTATGIGGAIYSVSPGIATISNAVFINNTSPQGGAIATATQTLISNCTFIGNVAKGTGINLNGGALHINQVKAFVTIIDSQFINNSANKGGAINIATGAVVNISNSLLEFNKATNGGAIYNIGSTLTILNGSFLNNTQIGSSKTGAVIHNAANSFLIINGGLFENNSATSTGSSGVIYNTANATINGGTFKENIASTGGAINNYGNTAYLEINGGKFINNSALNANYGGGVIYNDFNGKLLITNGEFIDNKASNGAVIYNTNSIATISGGTYTINVATGCQKGVILYNNKGNVIYKNTIVNDYITSGTGLIYNNLNLTLENNVFNSVITVPIINNDNNGVLYLNKNTMGSNNIEKILNNGKITSNVTLTIMDNSTVYGAPGASVNLNATLEDDNGNRIVGQTVTLTNPSLSNMPIANYNNGLYETTVTVNPGNYLISGYYAGGNNLTIKTGLLLVNKEIIALNYNESNMVYNENQTIDIFVNNDASGTITINYNGKNQTATISNGKVSFSDLGLNAGPHEITISYSGDDKYDSLTKNITVNVLKANVTLNYTESNMYYGGNKTLDIFVNEDATRYITIHYADQTPMKLIDNGHISFSDLNLTVGKNIVVIEYSGDANYNRNMTIISVEVLKANTSFTYVDDMVYNGDQSLDITFNDNVTGNVTIYYDGKNKTVAISNGKVDFNDLGLSAGNHDITVSYSGDDNYNNLTKTIFVNVLKANTSFSYVDNDMVYNGDQSLDITFNDNVTGNVTIFYDGKNKTVAISDGKVDFNDLGLSAGNYDITVSYSGDNNYNTLNKVISLSVAKANITFNYSTEDMISNKNQTIDISVENDASGTIIINYNGKNQTATISNGKVSFTDLGLSAGSNNITLVYSGDNNYNPKTETINVDVINGQLNTNITINNPSGKPGEEIIINGTLTDENGQNINGSVIITLPNGQNVTANVVDGKYNYIWTIPTNIIPGDKKIIATYDGSDDYISSSVSSIITVEKLDTDLNISTELNGKNLTITVNVDKNATGNITINIGNISKEVPIINGTATTTVDDLDYGNYTLNVTYSGDDYYNSKNNSSTVIIPSIIFKASDITLYYKNGTGFIAYLIDSLGNPIIGKTIYMAVNGVTYERITNESGITRLNINLDPRNYTIVSVYNETEPLTINNIINVLPTIQGKDVIKYYKNGTHFYGKYLDGQGKGIANLTVPFNINGVYYERLTNSDGVAELKINLDPGKYILTTTHPKDGLNMSYTVEVLTTIFGEDIVKYYRNGTQYKIELLDDLGGPLKNAPVVSNINGVFYTRYTNDNGIATLNINLDPGEYILTAEHPNGLRTSNIITVYSILYINNLVMSQNDRKSWDIKIVDGNGNPASGKTVTININGVFYQRVSDANGIARLNVNLDPGNYIATAYYGDYELSSRIIIY